MENHPLILYVEDDPSSILVMKTIVQKVMGIQTLVIFQDSAKFMETMGDMETAPDLILLDIHMRPYDGFDLLQKLRANDLLHHSRIIAVTASVMGEEIDRLKRSGFDGAISKPLNIALFPELISRILAGESVWSVS